MKHWLFLATCFCCGVFSALIAERAVVGICSAGALWFLLLSVDAIANPATPEERRSDISHGDVEL